MKRLILLLMCLVVVSGFVLTGCQSSQATEYVFVSLPNDGGQMSEGSRFVILEMNKALKPFNATVKYVSADDYSVVSESILTGTAHIGTPSGATYTKAHMENSNVIPLFISAPKGIPEDSGYPAYIGTHIDNQKDFEGMNEQEALASLKGKSFSFVSATSTSGRLVPTTTLWNAFGPMGTNAVQTRQQIFELDMANGGLFSEVQYGGNHPGNVELIINKKVYAGAFCCDYAGENMSKLHIIAKTMVPNGPYWVNKDYMKQEHIDALVAHFIALTPETAEPGMFSAAAGEDDEAFAYEDRFVAVTPDFYNFLEEMYRGEE